METELMDLIMSNPKLAAICTFMYLLRMVMKPMCSAVNKYIQDTPSTEDDLWLHDFLEKPVVKQVAYLIDLFASIKVHAKKPENK